MILCNPDETKLHSLIATNRRAILRYNDVSELFLTVNATYENSLASTSDINKAILNYYDKIESKRLILVDEIGYFVITSVEETDDGISRWKDISAKSIQSTLSSKLIKNIKGTYNFYNPEIQVDENGNPNSFIALVISLCPGWSVGTIDSVLCNKYRSIEANNQGLLSYLYDYIENAYQCIIEFDILNKTISATSVETLTNTPTETSIYLSFDNVLQNVNINQDTNNIQTKLYVCGKDMDISRVNPLGTPYIMDFHYYKTTEWMSQSLIDALNVWETKIENYMDLEDPLSYPSKMVELYDLLDELQTLQSNLADYQNQLEMYESVKDARKKNGLSYRDLTSPMNKINTNIANTQSAITAKNNEITTKRGELAVINEDVKMENNFTSEQLFVLDRYISEDVYTTDNYIITSQMTNQDIIGFANDLYSEGKLKLYRRAEPSVSLSINSSNFIFKKDFEIFTQQIKLGCVINIEKGDENVIRPLLHEIEIPWDNPSDFNIKCGDRFRIEEIGSTYQAALNRLTETKNKLDLSWSDIYHMIDNYDTDIAEVKKMNLFNDDRTRISANTSNSYVATTLRKDLNSVDSVKITNFLNSDTSNINNLSLVTDGLLISIYKYIEGDPVHYRNSDDDILYWIDNTYEGMTTEFTSYPVYTYNYEKQDIGTVTVIPSVDGNENPIDEGAMVLGGLTLSGSGTSAVGTGNVKCGTILITDDGVIKSINTAENSLLDKTHLEFKNGRTYIDGIAFEVVSDYPATEEPNVLYIKTGAS